MYVEYFIPADRLRAAPIIMIHGGLQTGTNFTSTPDGREGWAQYFVRRGSAVYVVDQVARGRSPHWNQTHGPVTQSSFGTAALIENRFTATAEYRSWPQASLHTQFPGSGRVGDPEFLQFYAGQFPSLDDYALQQTLNRDALVALLDRIGPAILITHSQSAPFGWCAADARPALVKAIVAMEPNGPPVHAIVDGQAGPDWYCDEPTVKAYGLTSAPLTYDPPVTPDRPLSFVRQDGPDGPDLVRCWRQADFAARLTRLAGIPIGIFVGEASYHAPYDHCTSAYLQQAGVVHDFVRLTEFGIRGNGHIMMVERNSDMIAAIVADWLADKLVLES